MPFDHGPRPISRFFPRVSEILVLAAAREVRGSPGGSVEGTRCSRNTLGETCDEAGCMSGIQALKRDRFQYVTRVAHPSKHTPMAKLVWSVRNSKLLGKRAHDLVDSFVPALFVAPMSGNKASLLYTQCMSAVLCVGPGFVRAALLWVERSFFRDTRSIPSVSHHSYEWDAVCLVGFLSPSAPIARWDLQCLMTIGGPHLSLIAAVGPDRCLCDVVGAVGPSALLWVGPHILFLGPVNPSSLGGPHIVRTRWVPALLWVGPHILFLGPGQSMVMRTCPQTWFDPADFGSSLASVYQGLFARGHGARNSQLP